MESVIIIIVILQVRSRTIQQCNLFHFFSKSRIQNGSLDLKRCLSYRNIDKCFVLQIMFNHHVYRQYYFTLIGIINNKNVRKGGG